MALYPGAVQRPLGKSTSAMSTPDILCLHTMVGYLKSTDSYFRQVGTFSHFGIGGIWGGDKPAGLDGVVYQWGNTSRQAAANLNGNDRTISIETADNAARPIQPWTPKQQAAIVNLMVWANKTHGIPLVLIPDTKQGRRGIGYHRQGCDPYRVAAGEKWSNAYGKDCPTAARISQIPALIARAKKIAGGGSDDMPLDAADKAAIKTIVDSSNKFWNLRAVAVGVSGVGNQGYLAADAGDWDVRTQLSKIYELLAYGDARNDDKDPNTHPNNIQRVRLELAAMKAENAAMAAAIAAISVDSGVTKAELETMVAAAAKAAVDDVVVTGAPA